MTQVAFTPRERRLAIIAVMVVFLLSALDSTVVSTAMPRIIAQLNGLDLYAWVTTAYMLTSTILVPIYGKLGDLYGRKPILIIGIAIFLFGSALCGLSGEFGDLPLLGGGMTQLIVFRAIQGVGGAALFTTAFAIIADLFPPRERAKMGGLFGSVFGFAMILGPLIGGFFTDHGTVVLMGRQIAGWRGVFYVNLPLGLFSLVMIATRMPQLSHKATGKVDYLGAALFITAFVPLLLALTWGGVYSWTAPRVLVSFAIAATALIAFFVVSVGNKNALIPLDLFRNRTFAIANSAAFVVNMAFLGIMMILPFFMQIVQGVDATKSGLAMLPFMGGMILASIGSGNLASRTGRYKPFIIAGFLTQMVGIALLTQIGPETRLNALLWRLFLVGFGLGPTQSLFNIAVQNAVPPTQIGIATSAGQFSRQIGGTIGIAIFGTLLTTGLGAELPKHLPASAGMSAAAFDLGAARAQAMNPNRTRDQVDKSFDERYQRIAQAFHGDPDATKAVLADPNIPEPVKTILRDNAGHSGPAADQALASIKTGMDEQARDLAATINRGTREAFSATITGMFGTGLGIALLSFLIVLFLPELPLRQRTPTEQRAAATAA